MGHSLWKRVTSLTLFEIEGQPKRCLSPWSDLTVFKTERPFLGIRHKVVLPILLLTRRKFLKSFARRFEAIARRISAGATCIFEFVEELEGRQGSVVFLS